jgi:hypothetical protein
MYTKGEVNNPALSNLRRGMCLGLELWHTFKIGTKLIYQAFALTVFAPLFHHLCPGNSFMLHATVNSMPKMHFMMTGLRMAFTIRRRKQFKELLETTKDSDSTRTKSQRSILRNIMDLLQFYIPAVSCTHVVNMF